MTRVAREVGTEGRLGGQAQVRGVSGVWRELTENVNSMANNLTIQVRNIAEVTTAIAAGDLSRKITVEVKGEILELKNTINTMVDQLGAFAAEVTRVAREVGTEGVLGGQAEVAGVSGVWRELTENVNSMANNLTSQVRNIAEVVTAIAEGDLRPQDHASTRAARSSTLKNTINATVDKLNRFAAEVTRVARLVGTEGTLGVQADVKDVSGIWKELTDNVNLMGRNLTDQVRDIAEVTTAVANGDLSQKITVEVKGEILALKNTINAMVDSLALVRRRGDPHGARGRHRGRARRPGGGARRVGHLEGAHRERELDGQQPDQPGAQHRRGGARGRRRRPVAQDHRRRARRGARAQEHAQRDGRSAERVRRRGDARRARGRRRGPPRRSGRGRRACAACGRS